MDCDRLEQWPHLVDLLRHLYLVSSNQVQSNARSQFNLDILAQVVLDVEEEGAAVLIVEEFKRAFEIRAADSLQSNQHVVKDVTAHEVYTLLRLLGLCSLPLTVQAHRD